jgi:hypothetical protein
MQIVFFKAVLSPAFLQIDKISSGTPRKSVSIQPLVKIVLYQKSNKKTMKQIITLSILIGLLQGCKKSESKETATPVRYTGTPANEAPYGQSSKWKCIGGDTLIEEILQVDLYYVEKTTPCDIYYYQLSYSIWNDYDYTHSVSACIPQKDTLILTDLASGDKAYYIKHK